MILKNIDETRQWAKKFAVSLHVPQVVALHGDLGVGKSEIARTIIKTLCGSDTIVPSPTFTVVQTYQYDDIQISHFDLYRITDVSELTEICLIQLMDNTICLIEWPDIAEDILPSNTIHIYITECGEARNIEVKNYFNNF